MAVCQYQEILQKFVKNLPMPKHHYYYIISSLHYILDLSTSQFIIRYCNDNSAINNTDPDASYFLRLFRKTRSSSCTFFDFADNDMLYFHALPRMMLIEVLLFLRQIMCSLIFVWCVWSFRENLSQLQNNPDQTR